MNKVLENLIEVCNKVNHKVLTFQETNPLTNLPRARVKDIDKEEIFFVEYEDGKWFVL